MSDEKPFAEVVQDSDTCRLWVGRVYVRHVRSKRGDKGMDDDAAAINDAVAAERRDAAAKALREAADIIRETTEYACCQAQTDHHVDVLRARADAVERGE